MNNRNPMPDDNGSEDPMDLGATGQDGTQPVAGDGDASRIEALTAELGQMRDQMLRALAEAENTRKRLVRERDDVRKYAVTDFARDLLDFSDNFRRALAAIPHDLAATDDRVKSVIDGVTAMEKALLRTFEKHGIKKTEPLHEPFDPNVHEVMFEAPGTGKPAGTIIELIEPGYVLHDRLLRPARVGVAKDEGQGKPGHKIDTEA